MNFSEAKGRKKGGSIVDILGVGVTGTNLVEVLTKIVEVCGYKGVGKPFFVVTANPEIIMLAQDDGEYKKILNWADLVVPDGAGLRLAGMKEVIPGRRLVEELLKKKLRFFYLGGRDGVAKEMAKKYGGEYDSGSPNIKSQITNHKKQTNYNNQITINKINKYQPDVLLVAYGAPWQEKWIYGNLGRLTVKVVIGVGGTFDYLTGRKKLPPKWMEKVGLEWLWRLVHEPWRWRRQLSLVRFAGRILVARAVMRVSWATWSKFTVF